MKSNIKLIFMMRFITGVLKMKALVIVIVLLQYSLNAQSLYFPPVTGNNWETVSPVTLGWCEDKIDTLLNFLESQDTKAFIVLQDGKIAIEQYYGNFTQDSFWYWASAGKSLTSYLVGIAQQEGFLSLDDPTSNFLGNGWTSCPPEKEDLITIRHQVSMTSGLDDGVEDNYCTLDTCLLYLADAGTRWAYHNAPYTLLDGVLENATGQTMNVLYYNKFKIKTGMNGFYIPSGYNNLLISNARSMARFGLLTLNQGIWDNIPVLDDPQYFQEMTNSSQLLNPSYGYLWWLNGKSSFMLPTLQFSFNGSVIPSAPDDMIAALGKNGQIVNVVPSRNLVFIRMGNAPEDFSEVPNYFTEAIWQRLNQVFCNSTSDQVVNDLNLVVHPNPFEDYFNILNHSDYPGTRFELLDINGRIVLQGDSTNRVQTDFITSGLYWLRLYSHENVQMIKLVKTK